MCVRALRITVLKSAGNFTRDECHDLNAEKIQRVKCFLFTRCGICCVLAIFERRRGRLGSKIAGYGQFAEVAVYFAMSGLPPIVLQKSFWANQRNFLGPLMPFRAQRREGLHRL
jgi:hypothetical protein